MWKKVHAYIYIRPNDYKEKKMFRVHSRYLCENDMWLYVIAWRVFFLFWIVSFVVEIHCYTFDCKIWFDLIDLIGKYALIFLLLFAFFFFLFWLFFLLKSYFFSTIFLFLFFLLCFFFFYLFIFQKRINEVRRESIS
jgi:hypothetical protein